MCVPRCLTQKEMLGFNKWKRELAEEDIKLFGEEIKRLHSAYLHLYSIYLDKFK